jgi:hypothetical protein
MLSALDKLLLSSDDSLLLAMVLVGILGELFGDDAELLQTDDGELNGQRTQ